MRDGYYLRYIDIDEDGIGGFEFLTVNDGKLCPGIPTTIVSKAKAAASREAISTLTAENTRIRAALEQAEAQLVIAAQILRGIQFQAAQGSVLDRDSCITDARHFISNYRWVR